MQGAPRLLAIASVIIKEVLKQHVQVAQQSCEKLDWHFRKSWFIFLFQYFIASYVCAENSDAKVFFIFKSQPNLIKLVELVPAENTNGEKEGFPSNCHLSNISVLTVKVVVPFLPVLLPAGNMLELQTLRTHPRPPKSETGPGTQPFMF